MRVSLGCLTSSGWRENRRCQRQEQFSDLTTSHFCEKQTLGGMEITSQQQHLLSLSMGPTYPEKNVTDVQQYKEFSNR